MWEAIKELFKRGSSFVIVLAGCVTVVLAFVSVSGQPPFIATRGTSMSELGVGVFLVAVGVILGVLELGQARSRENSLTNGLIYVLRHMESNMQYLTSTSFSERTLAVSAMGCTSSACDNLGWSGRDFLSECLDLDDYENITASQKGSGDGKAKNRKPEPRPFTLFHRTLGAVCYSSGSILAIIPA
jgi:hypothetical protein